jgi:hypothetical protein
MPEQTQRGFYPSENLGMEAVADPGWTDELRAADDPAKLMAVVHLRELADEFLYGGELFPFLAGKLRMKGKLLAGPLAYAMGYTWFREAHRPETDLSAFMDQLEQNEVLAHY